MGDPCDTSRSSIGDKTSSNTVADERREALEGLTAFVNAGRTAPNEAAATGYEQKPGYAGYVKQALQVAVPKSWGNNKKVSHEHQCTIQVCSFP